MLRSRGWAYRSTVGLLCLPFVGAAPLAGALCSVPGTYPTLRQAADDPACSEIQLGAQLFVESVAVDRSVMVSGQGASSTIVGGALRAIAGADLLLAGLRVSSGCDGAIQAVEGGRLSAQGVEAVLDPVAPCPGIPLFSDGFEASNTARWSSSSTPV